MMDSFNQTEHDRLIADLICIGRIVEVDHQAKRLKVRTKTVTGWLPWPAEMGRNYRRWRPLRAEAQEDTQEDTQAGQQVILASPSGDLAQAVIVGMLYTETLNAPSNDPDIDLIEFTNGAHLSHNVVSGDMTITCKGNLSIDVAGTLTLSAQAHIITGPITQSGGDITSDGISAQHHTHSGIKPGAANTGGPE